MIADDLRAALNSITADWDAPLAPLRAVRAGIGGKPHGGPAPLPIPVALSDARLNTATALFGWCGILVEERGLEHAAVNQADVPGMCRLLATHADWWETHDAGADMVAEVKDRADRLHKAVAPQRPGLTYLGNCGYVDPEHGATCWQPLYAPEKAPITHIVKCRSCGSEFDMPMLYGNLRDRLANYLATEAELMSTLMAAVLGSEAVSRSKFRRYVAAGVIESRGTRVTFGRPAATYRFGDMDGAAKRWAEYLESGAPDMA